MRKLDGFEGLASSLGTVECAWRGGCPPMAVLSNSCASLASCCSPIFSLWKVTWKANETQA